MKETRRITEIALLVALAVVFDLAFSFLPKMPQGGSLSLATLPLFILAWRHGVKWGVISGFIYGLLNYMLAGYSFHFASIFLDYIFAFGVIGFSAIFKVLFKDSIYSFSLGIIFGNILRFLFHFVSGFLIYYEFAGDENIYLYSFTYNITYMLPSMILVLIFGIVTYYPIKNITDTVNN